MRVLLVTGIVLLAALAGCTQAPKDTDQDGLSDAKEVALGTDPAVADTDHDNVTDGAEVNTDHTDPKNADTDGDTVPDGTEIARGMDPLNAADGYQVPPVPKVDAADLLADHATFVRANPIRKDNLPTHESARADLMEHFRSYGLTAVRFNFTDGIPQADIMGIKWGVDREHWVFVGGHYDTTHWDCLAPGPASCAAHATSQGAYDDGSGTMITVHLAKAFANVSTYYTIAFVAYDGEERGIQGAAAIVQAVGEGSFEVDGIHPTIVGDLDIDMFGINWPGTNAPMNLLTNSEKAASLIDAKRKDMGVPDDQFIRKDALKLGSSDYSAFWGVNDPAPIPTVFFISDFEEIGSPSPAPDAASTPFGAYPFWHFQDTVESMTAMAGGPADLQAGFQAASDLTASVVHFMACQPGVTLDAVPK